MSSSAGHPAPSPRPLALTPAADPAALTGAAGRASAALREDGWAAGAAEATAEGIVARARRTAEQAGHQAQALAAGASGAGGGGARRRVTPP